MERTMLEETLLKSFIEIGRDMFLRGLISSHAGNMSVRKGKNLYITRRGSMLGRLSAGDIVGLDLEHCDETSILEASSEFVVHRSVYISTDAHAVVHAHPSYATLLSMTDDELVPIDSEGSYFFERVIVVNPETTIASQETAAIVGGQLKNQRIVLVRGHGSFACGDTLEEAYMLTSSLESSAFYLYHMKTGDR